MRVVVLSRDFPPAASGMGDYADRLATELSARDLEVTVVCSYPADAQRPFAVIPDVERWDGAGVEAIVAAVAEAQPDAILWNYNPFQVGRRGVAPSAPRLARELAKVAPLVLVLHELWYPWGRNGLKGLVWAVAQRMQLRGVMAAATKTVVTTDKRKAHLERLFPKASVEMIPIGANVAATGVPNGTRARLGIPADAFVLAHLGAIGEGRNLAPALTALASLRAKGEDVRLVLVGRTGIPVPRAEGVHATGILDHDGLSASLKAADAYLFAEPTGPTSRKGSLLAALEHGLPVVAYRGRDGEPQFAESALLVEPEPKAIATAVRRLRLDPAYAKALGRAARNLADARYSWHAITDAFVRMLGEIKP
jgi:glycosyltransferase involved in cell wall biosynthesis